MAGLLVRADGSDPWVKGVPVDIVNDGYGGMILPEFVLLDVTDGSRNELSPYLEQWKTNYKAAEPATRSFRRIDIRPEQPNSAQIINGSPVEVQRVAVGTVIERGRNEIDSSVLADVEPQNTVASVDEALKDRYDELLSVRRWSFPDAFVDSIIASGGSRTLTLAEVQAEAIDGYG